MPDGYTCADHGCPFTSLWQWAETTGARYYPGDPHPGLTATLQGAEQVTGLAMDEYVVLDMRGLAALVDAVGGVTVDIHRRLPIGGSANDPHVDRWLEPGRHHLDGEDALWFARSRFMTSDIDRMGRQRCLLAALVDQVDAGTLATRLPRLLTALKGSLTTSLDVDALSDWVSLAARVRQAPITLLGLGSGPGLAPDYPAIRESVRRALAGAPTPTSSSSDSSSAAAADGC